MSLKINYAKFSAVFALPQLSEQTLCTASAEALRLLLYLMQNQPQVIDPRYLADRLMIPYQQVLDGLDFWCREGLLCHRTDLPAAATTRGNTAAAAKDQTGTGGIGRLAGTEKDDVHRRD